MRLDCEKLERHAIPEWWQSDGAVYYRLKLAFPVGGSRTADKMIIGDEITVSICHLIYASLRKFKKQAKGTLGPDYCLPISYRWEAISIVLNLSQHVGLQKQT